MAKWDQIQKKLVAEREKLFDLEDDYHTKKEELDGQSAAIENFHQEMTQSLDLYHTMIARDYSKLEGATEEMFEAAKESLNRYREANDSEFSNQRKILEKKYDNLEKDFKKSYRNQEEKVEYYQAELRKCE